MDAPIRRRMVVAVKRETGSHGCVTKTSLASGTCLRTTLDSSDLSVLTTAVPFGRVQRYVFFVRRGLSGECRLRCVALVTVT